MSARIVAIMATIPSRSKPAAAAVAALAPQLDGLVVLLHGHDAVPAWARRAGVESRLGPRAAGPAARFRARLPHAAYVLFVDDDFVYPSDYVARTVRALVKHKPGVAVTYHGGYWLPKRHAFTDRKLLPYFARVDADVAVTYLGAGLSAFHAADLARVDRQIPASFEYDDDIWMSAACARARVRLIRPATSASWIRPTPAASHGLFNHASAATRRSRAMTAALKLGGWRLSP